MKKIKKIKSSNKNLPNIVDDCNNDSDIADVFANKYKDLYGSVPFCTNDIDKLKNTINELIEANDYNEAVIRVGEVQEAISKLKLNKSDGIIGLHSNHFVNAGDDLHVHLAMLLTGCLIHGFVPEEL